MTLPYLHRPHDSGPIQWARGDVGLKPSAAARPHYWCDFNSLVEMQLTEGRKEVRAEGTC